MTGTELRDHRKAAGLSQVVLARLAGVGRHAVQYWEAKATVDARQHAPRRLLAVLGVPDYGTTDTRARAWGFSGRDTMREQIDREVEAQMARQKARTEARLARTQARARVPCGALTRQGHPCRLLSEPGRKRCKYHGGKSTGPRTAEGRARIAEAQRRRWAAKRDR